MTLDSRYNFAPQFLMGATTLAKLAKEIEDKGPEIGEDDKSKHLTYVTGSIMQSVASLEAEAWNLLNHGPGHQLGSNDKNLDEINLLLKHTKDVEKEETIVCFEIILKILGREKLDKGSQPTQDACSLIRLRNEITHYKSKYSPEVDTQKFLKSLLDKDSTPPPFRENVNFFPLQCLSYNRAAWGVNTSVAFIEHFYKLLNVKSPLATINPELLKP